MIDMLDNVDVLARTLWGEARGEGVAGMVAVGWVIKNRAEIAANWMRVRSRPHPLFGNGTIAIACTKAMQFSCWNASDPNRAKLLAVTNADPGFAAAAALAGDVAAGRTPDPTASIGGATHYHEASIRPYWSVDAGPGLSIGRHVFYRLP